MLKDRKLRFQDFIISRFDYVDFQFKIGFKFKRNLFL